jgi:hypothetical protein
VKYSTGLASAFFTLTVVTACGPSEEDKALKKERVDLRQMQHEALTAGEKECGAAQKRLEEFGAKNKDRIDKFNAKWEALDKAKRDKLIEMQPQSSKEVNDEIIALIISCPGVKEPVSTK